MYALYTDSGKFRFFTMDDSLLATFMDKYHDHAWRLVAIPKHITTLKEATKEARDTIYARRPSLKDTYKRTTPMACRITGSDKSYANTWNNGNLAIMPTTIL